MGTVADRQSRNGIAHLRKRYVRRAEYLAHDRDFTGYRQAIEQARGEWNASHPEYRIYPLASQEALNSVISKQGHLPPLPNVAQQAFNSIAAVIAHEFWPERDHFFYPDGEHPATKFVCACMHVDPWHLDPETFFELSPATLVSFVERPDPYATVRAKAERDALKRALADLLSDDPDRLAAILRTAAEQGDEAWATYADGWYMQNYWYISFIPNMSANDLKDAAGKIAGRPRGVNDETLAQRILALADGGTPREAIATQLGISIDAVRDALRSVKRPEYRIATIKLPI